MKWLTKMAEQGLIRKEVYDDILKDIALVKEGAPNDLINQIITASAITGLASGAAGALINQGIGAISKSMNQNKLLDNLKATRLKVLSALPREDQAKAGARFDEIAKIAPSVANNDVLVTKIVRDNLNSGISSDTAQRLALIQYNYGIKKVAGVRPEVLGDIVADIYLIKEAAGLDKMEFLKHLGLYSSIPLLVGGVGGAINWAASKLKEKKLHDELETSFKETIKGNSDTSSMLRSKPDAARAAFNTLVHFAPGVALNPVAARGFVAKLMEYQDRIDISDLKALTDVQKNMSQVKTIGQLPAHPFTQGFAGATNILGSGMQAVGAHASASKALGGVGAGVEAGESVGKAWNELGHTQSTGE